MTNDNVVIVGSGIAALQLAVRLNKDLNVRILTKGKLRMANSYLAQGGIAAAVGANDHPSKHLVDTLEAGRFHNNPGTVLEVIQAAPSLVQNIAQGDIFDRNQKGELFLGMEGAHSEKRIVHGGGDATGKNVMEYLISHLKENVIVEEDVFAYQLILNPKRDRCIGVKAKTQDGKILNFYGSHIVIASGGCGQLFSYTSNANTVTGDGIAMAYLAGADIVDMEFNQFHPTLLYVNGETKGLISEAVRGEGAILVTEHGTPIMEGIHPMKDLGPRHVVSQRIYEFQKNGQQVFLDIRNIKDFSNRFPSITSICEENGISLAVGKIPVVPGSHFLMGGIKADLFGRTSISGLYAIGEAACTGLHGANRLASNSLLEGLYQGEKLSKWINQCRIRLPDANDFVQFKNNLEVTLPEIKEIQAWMMERVGIVRNENDLKKQQSWLHQFNADKINLDACSVSDLSKVFMLITASLITESALQRTESRGGHYRSDYPMEDDYNWLGKSIIHQYDQKMEKSHEFIETAIAT